MKLKQILMGEGENMEVVAHVTFTINGEYESSDDVVHDIYEKMMETHCIFVITDVYQHFKEIGQKPHQIYRNIELEGKEECD